MAIFNFIETIFFISLGISFVLILLLVYHFKQSLNTLEQKGDTMFEIINNIVKELNNIKNNVINIQTPSLYNFTPTVIRSIDPSFKQNVIEELDKEDDDDDDNDDDNNSDKDSDINNEKDDDDDDDDDDSDKDSDNISILYTGEEEEIDVPYDEFFYDEKKIIVSDNENDENKVKDIKLISLGITETPEQINEIQKQQPEEVVINNIDESESNYINSKLETNKVLKMEDYKKLSTTALKGLVISKGLCSDASKMKKNELLKLLEIELDDDFIEQK